MRKTKIAIIGTVGIPAKYGGFETLCEHLVDELGTKMDLSVYCSGKKYPKQVRKTHYKGARLFYLPLQANGVQSILYDCLSILHALFYADVLLVLGVSGAILFPFVRFFTRKKIIVSIDGIEWKRNKWSKVARWYLWFAESLAVKYSHADIADNESIQDYTAIRYKCLSHIIEYGADHTLKLAPANEQKLRYPFLGKPYAFKVCRIEPENNIHIVLEAFSRLPQHTLVLVGNWTAGTYGAELRKQYACCKNIYMLDPIYQQQELDVLRSNAFLYIHGHSAGGTNPSLVEAMYLGLPIIAFDVSYNRTTTAGRALYFKSARDLVFLVASTPVQVLMELGATMNHIAAQRYTWSLIARKYAYLIQKTVSMGEVRYKVQRHMATRNLRVEELLNMGLAHLGSSVNFYEQR